jgi:ribosomal protein S18 acetylase RimI-like enzyme
MKILIKAPGECTDIELKDFERLVCAGGEVSTNGLCGLVRTAKKLLFAGDEKLSGVCGIRESNIHYRNNVFQKAGVADRAGNYCFEFCMLYVSPAARRKGVAGALLKTATGSIENGKCFATTRANNAAMRSLFNRSGFVRLGHDYNSGNGEYLLSLFGMTVQ